MVGIYNLYQNKTQEKEPDFVCSPITKNVAKQTEKLITFFGYDAKTMQHPKELSFKLLVENNYVARVIEGCNSISVIILFLAFIIAFSGKIMTTILFGVIGSVLIYGINIVRIAILSIGLLKFPKQETLLHNLVFPAIIYGFIILLWLIWVKKYAYSVNKNE